MLLQGTGGGLDRLGSDISRDASECVCESLSESNVAFGQRFGDLPKRRACCSTNCAIASRRSCISRTRVSRLSCPARRWKAAVNLRRANLGSRLDIPRCMVDCRSVESPTVSNKWSGSIGLEMIVHAGSEQAASHIVACASMAMIQRCEARVSTEPGRAW